MPGLRCAMLGAAVLAGLSVGPRLALAADDGYDNVFSSVLTAVGVLKADSSPEIDYRERAPLVLPPKNELGKPIAPVARSAAWPQDPDVLRRRREAEDARAPMPNLLGNPNALSSKQELLNGRTASADTNGGEPRYSRCVNQGNQRGCLVLSPDDLRAEHERYEAQGGDGTHKQQLQAGQEPERVYLTQPPRGYMKASKVVKATTEAPKTITDQSNPAAALLYKPPADE